MLPLLVASVAGRRGPGIVLLLLCTARAAAPADIPGIHGVRPHALAASCVYALLLGVLSAPCIRNSVLLRAHRAVLAARRAVAAAWPGGRAPARGCSAILDGFVLDRTRRFPLLWAAARASWARLLLLTACCFALEMATYHRSLLFIRIIGMFGSTAAHDKAGFWQLAAIWAALYAAVPLQSYLQRQRRAVVSKIASAVRVKAVELYLSKRSDQGGFAIESWNHDMILFSYAVGTILDLAPRACTQTLCLAAVASAIGWKALGPVALAAALVCFVEKSERAVQRARDEMRSGERPGFRATAAMLFRNMRTIKQYAWERTLLATFDHGLERARLPLRLRALEAISLRAIQCMSELVAAATLLWHPGAPGSLTYVGVSEYLYRVAGLAEFVLGLSAIPECAGYLARPDARLREDFDCHKAQYIARQAAAQGTGNSVEMNACVFSWGGTGAALGPVTLAIRRGEFVTVVGGVGSGKSSLLSAMCAEMPLESGRGRVCGSIGYVGQKPWVMNATLRENILLGAPYDKARYREVVAACALAEDFGKLPAGDLTEVGSRGINLSGGQKARLALARAVYADADIYVLDDILSAVDARTERHLVEDVLSASGLLGGKTRILVTHAEHIVPLSDKTVTLAGGGASIGVEQRRPAAWGTTGPAAAPNERASTGDEESSDKEGGVGAFEASPELDAPPSSRRLLWRYILASGWGAVLLTALVGAAGTHLAHYAEAKRMALLAPDGDRIAPEALRVYAVANLALKMGSIELREQGYQLKHRLWGMRSAKAMRSMLTTRLAHARLATFERFSSHALLDIYSNDLATMPLRLPWTICHHLDRAVTTGYSVIGLLAVAPHMVALAALAAGAVRAMDAWCKAARDAHSRAVAARMKSADTLAGELVDGHETLRVHRRADMHTRRLVAAHADVLALKASAPAATWAVDVARDAARVAVELAALGILWRLAGRGAASPSPGAVRVLVDRCGQCVRGIGDVLEGYTDYTESLPKLARYFAYLDGAEQEAPHIIPGSRPAASWPEHGAIEFRDYSMRYRAGEALVLDGLSFSTRGGERIGIVGRTGAGKSSLVQALLRMAEPASGAIAIDGVDVGAIGLYDLRSRISVVPQDPMLLEGTIRDNLDPGREYSDEEVWAAVRKARIEGLLGTPGGAGPGPADRRRGAGLDTWVDAGGRNYSVGQRQLVSLCRALLWRRRILVLDEATANVDSATDRLVQAVVRREFAGCTVLTIAHRLGTIMDSDRVLVMDRGRVAEFDAPARLLARGGGGLFAQLGEQPSSPPARAESVANSRRSSVGSAPSTIAEGLRSYWEARRGPWRSPPQLLRSLHQRTGWAGSAQGSQAGGRRVFVRTSAAVNAAVGRLVRLVVRDFVQEWYQKVTDDGEFAAQIEAQLGQVANEVEKRCLRVDWVRFALFELPAVVQVHVRDAQQCTARLGTVYAGRETSLEAVFQSMQPHVALALAADSELVYLRRLAQELLRVLMPAEAQGDVVVHHLLREILACAVLRNAIDTLSDPSTLNEGIIQAVGRYSKRDYFAKADMSRYVTQPMGIDDEGDEGDKASPLSPDQGAAAAAKAATVETMLREAQATGIGGRAGELSSDAAPQTAAPGRRPSDAPRAGAAGDGSARPAADAGPDAGAGAGAGAGMAERLSGQLSFAARWLISDLLSQARWRGWKNNTLRGLVYLHLIVTQAFGRAAAVFSEYTFSLNQLWQADAGHEASYRGAIGQVLAAANAVLLLDRYNQWAWAQFVFYILPLVNALGGAAIDRTLVKVVRFLIGEQQIALCLGALIGSLWRAEDGGRFRAGGAGRRPYRTLEQQRALKADAEALVAELLPYAAARFFYGLSEQERLLAARRILEPFENRQLNKHLVYIVLDAIVGKIAPELRDHQPQ
ncbi:Canalicular multispecific organic anion transporter 2 [Coemansia javaensis]|uniref:Canalicular multispecific organic anion transporter 2 n=1 Tax=Coemansia javaensis TaxID=2761396 RepID=A0A9W8HN20_9FUNG|nr:Canalicular multispecific organic anion transporter 2 [Coemansia javaensis]